MLQRNADSVTSATSYRSDIDGLRAVAVLSVLANHYGATWLPGGFTGVDIFFVISGYLITQGLVHDIPTGGNWLGRFYERRVRRLLPALAVVLLASLLAGFLILTPGDFAALGSSTAYSTFGLGNLFFHKSTGYFDQQAELQPLLHLWSLGVEEQFYFAWPLILAGLLLLGRRKAVWIALAAIIVSSLALAQHQLAVDPKAAFYLPFSRAWELAAGAVLVFLPAVASRRLSVAAVSAGLLSIAISLFFVSSDRAFPGAAAIPAVLGAALIVAKRERVRLDAVLANRFMVGIGLISYSLYLWHWPVLVFYRHYMNGAFPSAAEATVLALVSGVLAFLTWKYVEPLRKARLSMSKVLIGGACVSIILAVGGKIIQKTDGIIGRFPAYAQSIASLDEMWKWDACRPGEQVGDLKSAHCVFGEKWNTAKVRGILWGDSHAEHFAPLIESIMPAGTSVALVVPCPAVLGEHVRREWLEVPNYPARCKATQDEVVSLINSGELNWVVLAASWGPLSTKISQDGSLPSTLTGTDLVAAGMSQLLDRLETRPLVTILGQAPSNAVEPSACALKLQRYQCEAQASLADKITRASVGPTDAALSNLAAVRKVQFVSTSTALCEGGRCDPIFEGEPLYRDTNHLRRNLPPKVKRDLAFKIGLDRVFSR